MTIVITVATGFLSTPSARRATIFLAGLKTPESISIHALREEGDPPRQPRAAWAPISIHALREEGDLEEARDRGPYFISIHALREEGDPQPSRTSPKFHYFYPRPPRGGRLLEVTQCGPAGYFYPRPPRGGRPGYYCSYYCFGTFLSTPSARRATNCWAIVAICTLHFYPRPPRGGRPRRR